MRVLTATSATQGDRPDDRCWTTEGELVALPLLECSCADCGCDRSFTGLATHRATTTCVVTDVPFDLAGLQRAVIRALATTGWLLDLGGPIATPPVVPAAVVDSWADLHRLAAPAGPDIDALSALDRELVDDVVARILEVAGSFAPGAVLARGEGGIVVRRPAPAAAGSG